MGEKGLLCATLFSGYELSAQSLTILFNRFSKKRKYMNLDDFAACLSRVKIMTGGCGHRWVWS